ncbi:hypothetical protein AAZX31_02G001100 [Glycine max]|uniref:BolA-like protein n=2 Tax=Glycine subgen. Soja TaxID=1462606 RepID=I1JB41_SOYBN|nr:uncharacterized protein LOC100306682 [Glycine max]XP_028191595.1 protein BOLA4, chloroplastic/mitochondrial [Glycine soja]KAG4917144.1 hypothetical protein JHK87_054701 [Glycine soja]KAG5061756.1 hypothetical protein JHK85_002939 [Glycine max]KAG5078716.1 hypothetical protein JHK86_002781 [Glycine max]KAH1058043.1 hypothetical protein GYH30_002557 [Glycine max]KAH1259688.1 Protein BOLA4, chloroplastic/mitochondrial [Glycine max]|eukprot:NP_001238669.2 uncharacterized protein LOC100306682 [Glycine max]
MRSLSANPSLLRQAVPVLVKPYKSILSRAFLFSSPASTSHSHNTQFLRSVTFFSPTSLRNFNSRATHLNDAGSIDSPLIQSMQNKIKEQLNAESVSVKDAYGDGRHVSIDVVATAFEGQSAVNRQRMVYKAIWEELQTVVHAVDQMTTSTPAEAAAK